MPSRGASPAAPIPAPDVRSRSDVDRVVAQWRGSGDFTEQTLLRCEETLMRFQSRLDAQGVHRLVDAGPRHCSGFVHAPTRHGRPPELATQHARRTALRMAFRALRELGEQVGDPTLDLALPPRSSRAARPLTDDEIALCRASTRMGVAGSGSLQRAVAWALAEATAVTSEIAAVRGSDVDDPRAPRWVSLPGTRRHDPRLGELSEWGATMLARVIRQHSAQGIPMSAPLAYSGRAEPGGATSQAAACNAVSAVLDLAGLAGENDVRPGSVRNWAGRRLYDAGLPLERVARRLGARSLDTCAEDIALLWRDAPPTRTRRAR